MQICPKCGEENPDRFRLCGFCGAQLAVELSPQEVRKSVTVVFCDLKGSTSLGERLDTESLREVLGHYFARMKTVLESHGGTVEKYIGDAIMAVFGLPRAHEDDALRAVRAAADMQSALLEINEELERRWGVRLANRTGVNTGEVVAGDVTHGQRLVTGDTVNVAARLEQAAPEFEVLLGESTYRLVRDGVEVEALEPLELKGKAERVPAYRLLSVTGTQAITRHVDTPLVGRAAELALLGERFQRAVERRSCELVTVFGQAGVGKSRLIHELVSELAGTALSLRGRCLPYGEGITFWPLVEVIRDAAELTLEDPSEARARIAELAGRADVADRLAAVSGLSTEEFAIQETFWAARKLFEALSQNQPLIVVIDDIHWAEPTFLDLIEHVLEGTQDAPVLMLCTARHDFLEERSAWLAERPNATRLLLEPLSSDESAEIVENLLGDAPLPDKVRNRIISSAEGNPLFVEQILSMLIDEGLVCQAPDGTWSVRAEVESFAVPPSIFALLGARLDRLPGAERAVLERGGVVGSVFYQGAVVSLSPDPLKPEVPACLSSLTTKQMVRPHHSDFAGQEAFRFHHVLIRDTAYQGLLKRTRIGLHEAVAQWMEEASGSITEYEEIRGYHLEQAYRYREELGPIDEAGRAVGHRAAQLLSAAGERAFARGDMPAAANLMDRAASLLPEADPIRLTLLPDLGEALMYVGEFTKAREMVGEAIRFAAIQGDRRLEMDATIVDFLVRTSVEEGAWVESVLRESERAIEVLDEAGDHGALARAWRLVGWIQGTVGHYGSGEAALGQAIRHARLARDRRQEARSLTLYAGCALYGPTPVPEAIRLCEEFLVEATGAQRSEALIRLYLSQLHAMQGSFVVARALYRQSRTILQDLGERVLAAFTASNSARVEMLAEDPEAAEQELRRDFEDLDRMGEKYFLSTIAGLLAHAVYLQGRYEEAEELSRVSEETSEDDVESQSLWRRARSKALARLGHFSEAEALAHEALALSKKSDSPVLQANTLLDLGEVVRLTGQPSEAVPYVRDAVRLFDQKGNVVSAGRARQLLDELGRDDDVGSGPVSVGERVQPV
ncbi:MAG TPA: adenylate/guanylate cyclase domain-containing protein [Actinomycetota bacterium]|nr:adenylate/guanylate cyclase domain-containing protein [Actinomycetota bacterium]